MKGVWAAEEKKFAVNQKAFKTRLVDRLGWQEKVANQYKNTVLRENEGLVKQREDVVDKQLREQDEINK